VTAVGANPQHSTIYDWSQAADALREQRDSGVVRGYYDQEYLQALQRGELWITQAWSGDIFQANQLGHPELEFVIPVEGAMLWTDNMMIPLHAQHPVDAMTYMDFVYRPEVAAMIADWVWYITPVPASRPIIRKKYGDDVIADSPLVFPETVQLDEPTGGASPAPPTAEAPQLLWRYPVFKGAEELAIWRRFFEPIMDPTTSA
jgi:spermidine/putrescine transport system substrate-binding protein